MRGFYGEKQIEQMGATFSISSLSLVRFSNYGFGIVLSHEFGELLKAPHKSAFYSNNPQISTCFNFHIFD